MGVLVFGLLLSAQCLGFDKSGLFFFEENNMLERKIMLHTDEWGVKPPKKFEYKAYKGQENSHINWEDLDSNKWLDFNQWKMGLEMDRRDPDWRVKTRDLNHQEFVGKVIQCLNSCSIYGSKGESGAQFGSRIYEGHEFTTKKDSYAWLFLADGTLARVSPETSLSFIEINVAEKKVFFVMRVNQGHVYFQQRKLGEFPKQDMAETDLAMYPLLIKKANRSYYARIEYQSLSPKEKLVYVLEPNEGHVSQYEALNEMLGRNMQRLKRFESEFLVYTANATFTVKNPNFHIFRETAGKTWFKMKSKVPGLASSDSRAQEAKVYFRGYKNKNFKAVGFDLWHAMDKEGKMFTPKGEPAGFKMVRQFIQRIPTIYLAREIILREESKFLLEEWDRKRLAVKMGYRLWSQKEIQLRKAYLLEWTRRLETTNLRSIAKVFKGQKSKGFGRDYYIEALNRTLMALKGLHAYNQEVVKETDDAEYYLWIVKHAKPFLPTYLR